MSSDSSGLKHKFGFNEIVFGVKNGILLYVLKENDEVSGF